MEKKGRKRKTNRKGIDVEEFIDKRGVEGVMTDKKQVALSDEQDSIFIYKFTGIVELIEGNWITRLPGEEGILIRMK